MTDVGNLLRLWSVKQEDSLSPRGSKRGEKVVTVCFFHICRDLPQLMTTIALHQSKIRLLLENIVRYAEKERSVDILRSCPAHCFLFTPV